MRRRLLDHTYKRTVTGNPAIAKSVARMYPDISFPGKTEQASYEGKNLFDDKTIIEQFGIINPDSIGEEIKTTIYNSGVIAFGFELDISNLSNTQIIISSKSTNKFRIMYTIVDENEIILKGLYKSAASTSQIFRSIELIDTYKKLYVAVLDVLKENINIQIEKGSVATSWEPYTGGKPSPSPEYPQDIVNAQSPVQVEVTGAYLLDWDRLYNDEGTGTLHVDINGNKIHLYGNYPIDDKFPLLTKQIEPYFDYIGKEFTFSISKPINEFGIGLFFRAADTQESIEMKKGEKSKTRTISKKYNTVDIIIYGFTPGDPVDVEFELQLNYGNSVLPMEQYKQPQIVTISSDRPITKWDKLVKQNGVWGWLYKSNEVEFDGSDDEAINFYSGAKEENYTYYFVLNEKSYGESNLVCNKFLVKKSVWNVDEPYIISGHNSVKYIYFNVLKTDIVDNTVKSIKTWLQSNPIKVLYETENTEFVPLSQEEQDMLNALHTNNPTTIVQNSIGTDVTLTYKTKRSLEVIQ